MDQGPKYQTQNSEVSGRKSREYSGSNRYSKDFLTRIPAAQQLRERMDKWDFIKLKTSAQQKKWSLN
jgi:hypothetical protein